MRMRTDCAEEPVVARLLDELLQPPLLRDERSLRLVDASVQIINQVALSGKKYGKPCERQRGIADERQAVRRHLRDEFSVDLVPHTMQRGDRGGELVQCLILLPDHVILLLYDDLRCRLLCWQIVGRRVARAEAIAGHVNAGGGGRLRRNGGSRSRGRRNQAALASAARLTRVVLRCCSVSPSCHRV